MRQGDVRITLPNQSYYARVPANRALNLFDETDQCQIETTYSLD